MGFVPRLWQLCSIALLAGKLATSAVEASPRSGFNADLSPQQSDYHQLQVLLEAGHCLPLAAGSPLLLQAPLSRLEAASLLGRCLATADPATILQAPADHLRRELAAELDALELRLEGDPRGPGFSATSRLSGKATLVLGKPRL